MGKTYRSNPKKGKKDYSDKDADDIYESKSCRHHGGCPLCEGNRTYFTKKNKVSIRQQLSELEND